MTSQCNLCTQLTQWKKGELSNFIFEFENSILILGSHQFYEGYCVLLSKHHAHEMHELRKETRQQMFDELMQATTAISKAFNPLKMNHASLGNIEPHLHWHIFPRYESDPNHKKDPWSNAPLFEKHIPTPASAAATISTIRKFL